MNNNQIDLGKTIELTWFNSILNYAQVVNQETIEKSRNERLDRLEAKLDYLIELMEKTNE